MDIVNDDTGDVGHSLGGRNSAASRENLCEGRWEVQACIPGLLGPLGTSEIPKNNVLIHKTEETYYKLMIMGDVKRREHTDKVVMEERNEKRCCIAT